VFCVRIWRGTRRPIYGLDIFPVPVRPRDEVPALRFLSSAAPFLSIPHLFVFQASTSFLSKCQGGKLTSPTYTRVNAVAATLGEIGPENRANAALSITATVTVPLSWARARPLTVAQRPRGCYTAILGPTSPVVSVRGDSRVPLLFWVCPPI
jgi:hypothetical protein